MPLGGEWWHDDRKVPEAPHAFIQWKGTDVCMDFHCPCGVGGHFDGMFAYVVECPGCHKKYEMAWHVAAREVSEGHWHAGNAKMLQDD
jgi:hypothetical protein